MVYQLKISLLDVKKPPVWRRVLVDPDITFEMLHQVIQEAMGWHNCHLFSFGYKPYDPMMTIAILQPDDWDPPTADASKTKVSKFLNQQHPRMKYVYDFGDDWVHDVVLEKVFEVPEANQKLPICLEAKGACPPEDCGGPWGYEDLKALATKKNPTIDEVERLEWYGIDDDFDPKKVDKEIINQRLESLQQKQDRKRKIDSKKQAEREVLLRKLILDFSQKTDGFDAIVEHAFKIIKLLVDNDVNLAGGSPQRWVAAILIFAQEDLFMNIVNREDILNFFGVKASGVQNRLNTIYDTICDDDYFLDWDGDDEEDADFGSYDEDPLDAVIREYKAGALLLPPDLEEMLKKHGLI